MLWNSLPMRVFFFRLRKEAKKKKTYFINSHCCVIQAGEILSVAAGGVEPELKCSSSCFSIIPPAASREYRPLSRPAPGQRRALEPAPTLRPSKVCAAFLPQKGHVPVFILLSVVNAALNFFIPGRSTAFTRVPTFFFFLPQIRANVSCRQLLFQKPARTPTRLKRRGKYSHTGSNLLHENASLKLYVLD